MEGTFLRNCNRFRRIDDVARGGAEGNDAPLGGGHDTDLPGEAIIGLFDMVRPEDAFGRGKKMLLDPGAAHEPILSRPVAAGRHPQ